jgi:hypothetical protein
MRTLPLPATLAALVAALLSRPAAAAEWPDSIDNAAPADTRSAATEPAAAAAPRSVPAGARTREQELAEALFADEALSLDGRHIKRGGVSLKPGAFYALVERPDLAAQIRTRRIGKGIAIGVGAAAMTVGAVLGIADSVATSFDNGVNRAVNLCGTSQVSEQCEDRSHTSMAPWAIVFGGGFALVTGLVLPADPLGPGEKQGLVDDYNRRLRARMGLSSAFEAAKRSASVSAAVVPDGQSGMLLARCAF